MPKKTQVGTIRQVSVAAHLPDGKYKGIWGGYTVRFCVSQVTYEGNTSDGIRTPSAPCTVIIESGEISVELD